MLHLFIEKDFESKEEKKKKKKKEKEPKCDSVDFASQ